MLERYRGDGQPRQTARNFMHREERIALLYCQVCRECDVPTINKLIQVRAVEVASWHGTCHSTAISAVKRRARLITGGWSCSVTCPAMTKASPQCGSRFFPGIKPKAATARCII